MILMAAPRSKADGTMAHLLSGLALGSVHESIDSQTRISKCLAGEIIFGCAISGAVATIAAAACTLGTLNSPCDYIMFRIQFQAAHNSLSGRLLGSMACEQR